MSPSRESRVWQHSANLGCHMDENRWSFEDQHLQHLNCRWKVLAAILLWILAIICVFITAGLEFETPWNIDMNPRDSISCLTFAALYTSLYFTLFQTLIELDVCLRWESVIRRVIFLQQWTDRIDIGRICRRVVFLLSIGYFREGSVVAVKECRASCGHGP